MLSLAEAIMGKAGMDIIDLNGIISPGTYQNYFREGISKGKWCYYFKNVYNQLTIDHK
mgnify:CR=1 FL=1